MGKRLLCAATGITVLIFFGGCSAPPSVASGNHPKPPAELPLPSSDEEILLTTEVNGHPGIFLVHPDGSGMRRLTDSRFGDTDAIWSPDHSFIVFTRVATDPAANETPIGHLWSIKADGSNLKQLTQGKVSDYQASFSPDGSRITFFRLNAGAEIEVFSSVGLDGSDYRSEGIDKVLGVSPDRKWIVTFLAPKKPSETSYEYFLTRTMDDPGTKLEGLPVSLVEPNWKPDCTAFAVVGEEPSGNNGLYVVDVPTGNPHSVPTPMLEIIESPQWSPDDKRIAFVGTQSDPKNPNAKYHQLYVVNPDGTMLHRLTDSNAENFDPIWTRDGQYILINRQKTLDADDPIDWIAVDAYGKGERRITIQVPAEDTVKA